MYILHNKDRFITTKKGGAPPPNNPFNVIYLPEDLNAYKKNKSKDKN